MTWFCELRDKIDTINGWETLILKVKGQNGYNQMYSNNINIYIYIYIYMKNKQGPKLLANFYYLCNGTLLITIWLPLRNNIY